MEPQPPESYTVVDYNYNPHPHQAQQNQSHEPKSIKSQKYPETFLRANGINDSIKHNNCQSVSYDIEMASMESPSYTSLRDLIPSSSHSQVSATARGISPLATRKHGGEDIPIKNPLVKQAAIAYLQPMSAAPASDDRDLLRKGVCYCDMGCVEFFYSVVLGPVKRVFGTVREIGDGWTDEEKKVRHAE